MLKEIPKMEVVTISKVSDQLGVTGSLARAIIREMHKNNQIKPVIVHSRMVIYQGIPQKEDAKAADDKKGAQGAKKQPAKKQAKADAAE